MLVSEHAFPVVLPTEVNPVALPYWFQLTLLIPSPDAPTQNAEVSPLADETVMLLPPLEAEFVSYLIVVVVLDVVLLLVLVVVVVVVVVVVLVVVDETHSYE